MSGHRSSSPRPGWAGRDAWAVTSLQQRAAQRLASEGGQEAGEHPASLVVPACEWSVFPVCSAIIDRIPDYELDDVLTVEDLEAAPRLADPLRAKIVTLLRSERQSTTELAWCSTCRRGPSAIT